MQTFLDGLALDTASLLASQKNIEGQLTALAGEAENLAATNEIPLEKLAIINGKAERIPHLQGRVDNAARKLLEAHKAITYLRGELESLLS